MNAIKPSAVALGTRLSRWLDRALGMLAAILLFGMMALTFFDVLGRDAFSRPIPGAFEATEVMMGILIFAGLPLISARDGHVSVNLLDPLMGPRARRLQHRVVSIVGAVITAVLAYVLWHKAGQLSAYGDATAYLHIPLAPVARLMSIFSAFTVVVFFANAVIGPRQAGRDLG